MLTDKNSRRWIFEIATQKRLSLPVDAHWNGFISLSPAETEANRGVTRRASQLRFAIQHIHESFCSISRVDREGGGRGCLSRERESITSRVESGSSRNVTEKKKKKKSSNIERTLSVEDHFYWSLFTWRARRELALEDNAGFVCQAVTTQSIAKRDKTHDGTGRNWRVGDFLPLKGICKLVGLCASSTSVMRQTSLFVEDGCEKLARMNAVERICCKDWFSFFVYERTIEYFLEFIC